MTTAPWIQPRSATGVGVRRVNGAEASGFDADGKKIQAGFPSKLENDGGRWLPLFLWIPAFFDSDGGEGDDDNSPMRRAEASFHKN